MCGQERPEGKIDPRLGKAKMFLESSTDIVFSPEELELAERMLPCLGDTPKWNALCEEETNKLLCRAYPKDWGGAALVATFASKINVNQE